MPKKTFYLSEEDLTVYEKVKSIAGDSTSSIIMQGLKDYVIRWEKQELGFKTFQLFEGVEFHPEGIRQGQDIKFVGKLIASHQVEIERVVSTLYEMYLTRKGKYLVYTVEDDFKDNTRSFKKFVKDDVAGLRELTLPPELLEIADKNMPDLFIEVLDI